jgi:DNA-binding XRE family transcriptional regulator
MTNQTAKTLIAAIAAKCSVSQELAAAHLKVAKQTAKDTGMSVEAVLSTMGML